jgi:hypothetical protein
LGAAGAAAEGADADDTRNGGVGRAAPAAKKDNRKIDAAATRRHAAVRMDSDSMQWLRRHHNSRRKQGLPIEA